ncbi:MAG: rhodanese-like domain-containing protein [Pseudomonadota bacterium]|nr:rhodanese-like domain-containing protein [Pseudomonadota bacterium]
MSLFSRLLAPLRGAPQAALPDECVVIDVRSAGEYAQGHIEGALNLPAETIGHAIRKTVPDPLTPIVLYCRSGMRSGHAHGVLANMGYQAVHNGGAVGGLALRLQRRIVAR